MYWKLLTDVLDLIKMYYIYNIYTQFIGTILFKFRKETFSKYVQSLPNQTIFIT